MVQRGPRRSVWQGSNNDSILTGGIAPPPTTIAPPPPRIAPPAPTRPPIAPPATIVPPPPRIHPPAPKPPTIPRPQPYIHPPAPTNPPPKPVDTSGQFQNQPSGNAGPNYDGPDWSYDYETTDGDGPSGSSVVYGDTPEDQSLTPEGLNGRTGNASVSSIGGGQTSKRKRNESRNQMNLTKGSGSSLLTS